LLVKDYMEMFDVFNQTAQLPFNMEDDVETVDLSALNDMGGHQRDQKRPYQPKGGQHKQRFQEVDPEDEPDPEWIEFDPEKDFNKFFGHVMQDEEKLREKVVVEKEKKKVKEEEKKQKAIENAKKAAMLKLDPYGQGDKLDKDKLEQAQAIS
jgi:hypothetical protein